MSKHTEMEQTVRDDIETGGSTKKLNSSSQNEENSECCLWLKCLCHTLPPLLAIIVVMASLFGAISEDKKVNTGAGVGCFVFLLCHWGAISYNNV